ncbi:MAG: DUF2157 domain-containing protein [Bacteroidia bacterium]|nr:DUF2157 domain-containing protein [Bacteroidia bacterium]
MLKLNKLLEEWADRQIISKVQLEEILKYEGSKKQVGPNIQIVIFATIGAILVALGLSLIIAGNWDSMGKFAKTSIGFVPVILGLISMFLYLFKFKDSLVWREAASAFLTLSIGATMGMLTQVYQMQGNIQSFQLTWMVLALPIMFISRSPVAAALFLFISTSFGIMANGINHEWAHHYLWAMAAVVLFFVFNIAKKPAMSAIAQRLSWIFVISIIICFFGQIKPLNEWALPAYFLLFQVMLLGHFKPLFSEPKNWTNAFGIAGALGMVGVLFIGTSFRHYYTIDALNYTDLFSDPFSMGIVLFLLGIYLWFLIKKSENRINASYFLFPIFIGIYLIMPSSPVLAIWMFNLMLLGIGIWGIYSGIQSNNLAILNFGLVVISLQIAFRFFDIHVAFYIKGLVFLAMGAGFFIANRMILLNRSKKS